MFSDNDRLVRTDKGTRLCLSREAGKELPREMKTLLLAVDEETPYHMYRKHLHSFGDIDSLFRTLHEEELVRRAA